MNHIRIKTLTLWLIVTVSTAAGHNITAILSDFPEYSVFNDYLTQTRLADDINSRETLTVLVLNNTVVTEFVANQPLSVVKPALSIHVLLDYFDMGKLLRIGGGSVMTTTLYQTTGTADAAGFVIISDLEGGKIGFRSSARDSQYQSLYTKTVKQLPYTISVLEINTPIIALEIIPVPSYVNISNWLDAAGCRTFLKLLIRTGVLNTYQTAAKTALTVFAPSDAAFNVTGLPDFNKLSNTELSSLLLYHAIPSYVTEATLKNEKVPMPTLATNPAGQFALNVQIAGGSIMLNSGIHNSRVINMVGDSVPVCVFKIENVLLPTELFTTPPAPAASPTLAQVSLPPSVSAPASDFTSTPTASSPAPVTMTSPAISPPAPSTRSTFPTSSPAGGVAPADNPTADTGNYSAGSVDRIKVQVIVVLVIMSISGIFF